MRLVEIRSYKLRSGTSKEFHAIVLGRVVPMLLDWKIDVIAFGHSAHEPEAYFLVRGFSDLATLEAEQQAFYGSAAWRDGPREAVLARIESFLSTVLWLSESSVDDLRRSNSSAGQGSPAFAPRDT